MDALGNPLDFVLTSSTTPDITQARRLLGERRCDYLIADKGYDAEHFVLHIRALGAEPVIPSRKNRKVLRDYDKHLYRERHLIECCINKLKHYRRLFSRFDKLDGRFMGFLRFVAALIWLK